MPFQGHDLRSLLNIPKPYGAIVARRSQEVAVRTEYDRPHTLAVWPVRVASGEPVLAFHNRTVRSALEDANFVPSGLKATLSTGFLWPLRLCIFRSVCIPN